MLRIVLRFPAEKNSHHRCGAVDFARRSVLDGGKVGRGKELSWGVKMQREFVEFFAVSFRIATKDCDSIANSYMVSNQMKTQ